MFLPHLFPLDDVEWKGLASGQLDGIRFMKKGDVLPAEDEYVFRVSTGAISATVTQGQRVRQTLPIGAYLNLRLVAKASEEEDDTFSTLSASASHKSGFDEKDDDDEEAGDNANQLHVIELVARENETALVGVKASVLSETFAKDPLLAARFYTSAARQLSSRLRELPAPEGDLPADVPLARRNHSHSGTVSVLKGVQRRGKTSKLGSGAGKFRIYEDHFTFTTRKFGMRSTKDYDPPSIAGGCRKMEGKVLRFIPQLDNEAVFFEFAFPDQASRDQAFEKIEAIIKSGTQRKKNLASSTVTFGAASDANVEDALAVKREWHSLLDAASTRQLREGEVAVAQGDDVEHLFQVASGSVLVSNKNQAVTMLGAGEIFGEMTVLEKRPASATVTAGPGGCELFVMDLKQLASRFAEDPGTREQARFSKFLFALIRKRIERHLKRLAGFEVSQKLGASV